MKLTVEKEASKWFEEEVAIEKGRGIRIKTRIYDSSPINEGYGIAIEPVEPREPAVTFESDNGILFFIEPDDLWFFEGYDLNITLDDRFKEPFYQYIKDGQAIN